MIYDFVTAADDETYCERLALVPLLNRKHTGMGQRES